MGIPTVESEDFYKDLDPILDEINRKCVKMDEDIKKKYVDIINKVIESVIKALKSTDEVFEKLFSKLEYVGSYFDGLRVAKPTEFDLNLIMKLPCDYKKIVIENNNVSAGFVKLNILKAIQNNQQSEKVIGTVKKWCDVDGYLLENRVRQWMESVITCCLGHATTTLSLASGETVNIRVRKAGPAFTLNVNTGSDNIDVDLVFTIQFPESIHPPSSIRWNKDLAASWVVVPKPTNDPRFWRVSFNYSERKLTQNQYKLKLINRFLKALRDARDLPIPSYFIKTLFLWEAHNCTMYNKPRFWEKRQGYLFIYMMNELYSNLKARKILYYWHKGLNLFDKNKFTPDHALNMENQISRIISKINDLIRKKDKERLRNYILALFRISEELAIADLSLEDTTKQNEQNISCSLS
ncbi:unnamed protein product [Nezara viridula]|nr:unnamed protein product [Nezara viridula]